MHLIRVRNEQNITKLEWQKIHTGQRVDLAIFKTEAILVNLFTKNKAKYQILRHFVLNLGMNLFHRRGWKICWRSLLYIKNYSLILIQNLFYGGVISTSILTVNDHIWLFRIIYWLPFIFYQYLIFMSNQSLNFSNGTLISLTIG